MLFEHLPEWAIKTMVAISILGIFCGLFLVRVVEVHAAPLNWKINGLLIATVIGLCVSLFFILNTL